MKKHLSIIAFFFVMLTSQSYLFAYRYTFSNHTSYPLLIGIKLCCLFEELISKSIKPNKMVTFVHGQDFPNIKFGYCLQSISYVKNPTLKNKMKPEKAPWKEVSTAWIKTEAYDDILEFAQSLGDATEVGGKAIVKLAIAAGAAGSTGGASIHAMLMTSGAKKAKKTMSDVSSESVEVPDAAESMEQVEEVEPVKQSTQ